MDARKDQRSSILVHMDLHQQTQTIFWKSENDKPWCLLAWACNLWELWMVIYLTATFWRVLWRAIILDGSRYCFVKEMVKKVYIKNSTMPTILAILWLKIDVVVISREVIWPANDHFIYLFILEWLYSGCNFSELNVEGWDTNKRRKMFWFSEASVANLSFHPVSGYYWG